MKTFRYVVSNPLGAISSIFNDEIEKVEDYFVFSPLWYNTKNPQENETTVEHWYTLQESVQIIDELKAYRAANRDLKMTIQHITVKEGTGTAWNTVIEIVTFD